MSTSEGSASPGTIGQAIALAALGAGKVVAIATETFFGLLVDPERPAALDRLFRIKGRDAARGVALLVADVRGWRAVTREVPPLASALGDAFWPGALTVAVAARSDLDPRLVVDENVGVRIPGPSPARDLVSAYGAPLTATSANLSGEPAATTAAEVRAAFAPHVDAGDLVVVDGDAPGGAPSTVVVVMQDGYRIVRQGAVAATAIDAVARATK